MSSTLAADPQPPLKKDTPIHLTAGATIALIASMLLVGVSFGAIAPLVSAILELRGFSEYFTSGVTAILAVAIAFHAPRAGKLVGKFGAQRINTLGLLGQSIGFAGLGIALATNEVFLFPIRFWLGIAATMTFVAAEVTLLRGVSQNIRGRVMSAYGSALGFGFMGGIFAGNLAYDWLGLWCFGLVALVAALIAPLSWWGMRGPIGNLRSVEEEKNETNKRFKPALDWRLILLPLYCAAVFGALDTAISGTYPIEGQRLGLSRSQALNITGFMALGLVLGQPLAGWLADRFGSRRVLVSVGVIGTLWCIATGIASRIMLPENTIWVTLTFIGIGASVGGSFPVSLKILGDRVPHDLLPRANARHSAVYGYASLIGPMMASVGIDLMESIGYLGWAVPGLCGVTLTALVAVVWWDGKTHKV